MGGDSSSLGHSAGRALAAFDTLNFAPGVIENLQMTLLLWLPLSVLTTAALAFGIGGIDTVKKWWSRLEPKDDHSGP